MAENKKSFILYADLKATVDKLPDEKAGALFKIILDYVNDLNPSTDDLLLQIAFEPIKQTLKRDLTKWDTFKQKQSENGKLGGRPPKPKPKEEKPNNPSLLEESQKSLSVSVNGTVSESVNVITFKNHFDSVITFFSEDYELKTVLYKNQFTKQEFERFAITLTKITETYPQLCEKFEKCMSIGDWKKHLGSKGFNVLKPAIETMLAYKIDSSVEMAFKIKQFLEKEDSTVLKSS